MLIKNEIFDIKPFNLATDNIESIAVNLSYAGDKCYISDVGNKTIIYNEFIIFDGPRVKKKCNISFTKSGGSGKFIPRITFYKTNNEEIVEKKTKKIIIEFNETGKGLEEFWKLISFLKKYKDLVDTGDFDDKYQVVDNSKYISSFNSKQEFEKTEALKELDISEDVIKDFLSDKRKSTLSIFKNLLENADNILSYKKVHSISKLGEEVVWHHFFKNNPWILGLNTDFRFIQEFNDEVQVGNPNTSGVGNPKADNLGISDYTVLIELKTSNTDFFTKNKSSKARASTWSFTSDFIEGISQCLVQKTDWEKGHKTKNLTKDNKEVVDQDMYRTIDPNVIFITGNKQKEICLKIKTQENFDKRDTLERFRRNNRNIEIITYDELYNKAYFTIYQEKSPLLNFSENIDGSEEDINPEDMDF